MHDQTIFPDPPPGLTPIGEWLPEAFRLWSACWQVWVLQGVIAGVIVGIPFVELSGAMACYIGIVATLPFFAVAQAVAYTNTFHSPPPAAETTQMRDWPST